MTRKLFYNFSFLIILPVSLVFFSCASAPVKTDDSDLEITAPSDKSSIESSEASTLSETTDNTYEPYNDENESTEGEITESLSEEEIPEIEEPLVIDLVLPDEPETTTDEISQVESEPIEISEDEEYLNENITVSEENYDSQKAETEDTAENNEYNENQPEDLIETTEKTDNKAEKQNYDEDVISLETESSSTADSIAEDYNENKNTEDNTALITEDIAPSRSIKLKRNEYLDVVYPGSGWIFMGVTDGSKAVVSYGRKLGTANTTFTLLAKESGTKLLHFYKQDNLTGKYIDDYLEVEISSERTTSKEHKKAPDYKEIVPKKPEVKTEIKETEIKTPTEANSVILNNEVSKTKNEKQTSAEITVPNNNSESDSITPDKKDSVLENIDYETLLKEVKILYDEKEYAKALSKLNLFFEHPSSQQDYALLLKGQILEAESSVQNIKEAINAYTTLTKNHPSSIYWDEANKRIIYLKRFYLEAR